MLRSWALLAAVASAAALHVPVRPSRRAATAAGLAAATAPLAAPAAVPAARSRTPSVPLGNPPIGGGAAPVGRPGIQTDDLELAYQRRPTDLRGVVLPAALKGAADAVLIFHGSGGPDRETAAVEARFVAQDKAAGLQRAVANFNWMPWFTTDTDRLSFQSKAVGAKLGAELYRANRGLRSLHVVGTSAGGFAANEFCSAYVAAANGGARASVRLTCCDTFVAKQGTSSNEGRGAQFFGRDADFAEHILNTDDIVPNTSTPLPLCYCYDVTSAAERKTFPPPDKSGDVFEDLLLRSLGFHNWPMGYLARHYETALDAEGRVVVPSHADKPRGKVVRVA